MEEREVFSGYFVLYQERRIYVYKRTCPPTVLSFFLFFFTQRLVFLSNTTMSLFVSDPQSFPLYPA
jgi:hypothetical protein